MKARSLHLITRPVVLAVQGGAGVSVLLISFRYHGAGTVEARICMTIYFNLSIYIIE